MSEIKIVLHGLGTAETRTFASMQHAVAFLNLHGFTTSSTDLPRSTTQLSNQDGWTAMRSPLDHPGTWVAIVDQILNGPMDTPQRAEVSHVEEFEVLRQVGKDTWVRHASYLGLQDALDQARDLAAEDDWPTKVVKSVLIQGFSPS